MEYLKTKIEYLFNSDERTSDEEFNSFALEFLGELNEGRIRSAEPNEDGTWTVNHWVKQGILLLFRYGRNADQSQGAFSFFDKHTLPLRPADLSSELRIVPGGSSIRSGCYVARGVICMPPMYINIGSYVDSGSMIDSHALVGTCAQVGKRVHVSAAVQIGGVLEPMGARPVIIEDEVLLGGNCGIYEGVMVHRRAVLAAGVILTSGTKVFDLVNEKVLTSSPGNPLEIPEGAVVVPGSRAVNSNYAKENGLSVSAPMIVKYRDAKTDAATALNFDLR